MNVIFRFVRKLLGYTILAADRVTRPRAPEHPPEKRAALDAATSKMALYQFAMCPFCVKTRRAIHRLGLDIELRDARNDARWNQELVEQGGKYQVPCLRIEEGGKTTWLYESRDINAYLEKRFSA